MAFLPRCGAVLALVSLAGCPTDPGLDVPDASRADAGPRDAPVTTEHCDYEPLPATGGAGGTVTDAPVSAGAAEDVLHVPLGVTLGAYTTRGPLGGGDGFVDGRRTELAGSFAPSVGIETWPRARAIAISTGTAPDYEETVVLVKADLAVASQAILRAVEERLPPELAGKILFATSHSHGSFADYVTDALQVGFGPYRPQVLEAIVEDLVGVIRAALDARRPARVGIASTVTFDVTGAVTRDRRARNDDLPGGDVDDQEAFLLRIDATDGEPIAVVPIFGVHGTIHDGGNALVTTDAPGAIERVLEEHFGSEVVVMHLQGAAGDTSPVGLEAAVSCPDGALLCGNFGRAESVGRRALPELLELYDEAGAALRSTLELEMVTRTIERGPDWTRFDVRGGALRYAPWDGVTPGDGRIYDETGAILSPIDEFNAPNGAALCSTEGSDRALLSAAQIPGTLAPSLAGTPYPTCSRIEALVRLFRAGLQVETSDPPACDTTRAVLSAGRIGDYYFLTLPGEPMVIGRDRMRELAGVPPERLMVIGYAQDHHGYVMTAEDWLRGGYEPTITFWGPLDGEQLMEASVALLPLVTSEAREDAAAGRDRLVVHASTERFEAEPAPRAGTIPGAAPAYVANRLLPMVPTNADLPASAPRLASVFFTWIGEDPIDGTPVVTLERDLDGDGTFEPVRRRSGRPVIDGDVIVTWTPDPPTGTASTERVHYWTAEWQLVPPLGDPGASEAGELGARLGLPLGAYRLRVDGTAYAVTSRAMTVTPATLAVTLSGSELTVTAQAPLGFRLLDDRVSATTPVPLRGGSIDVVIEPVSGPSETRALVLDDAGRVDVGALPALRAITVTDRFGNTGTLRP